MEVPEPGPGDRVFFNTEMLDNIFSYLDPKSLVTAAAVCHKWRSVSTLSLKRRMRISNCIGWDEDVYKSCAAYRKLNRMPFAIAVNLSEVLKPKLYDPRAEFQPRTEFDLLIGNAVDELPLNADVRQEREELARRRAPPSRQRRPAGVQLFAGLGRRRGRISFAEDIQMVLNEVDDGVDGNFDFGFMGGVGGHGRGMQEQRLAMEEFMMPQPQVGPAEVLRYLDDPMRADVEPVDQHIGRVVHEDVRYRIFRGPYRVPHRQIGNNQEREIRREYLNLGVGHPAFRRQAGAEQLLSNSSKPKLLWTPLMMTTMLEFGWLKSVTHLILGTFLNIDDWNAVGCKILEAFRNVQWFELYLKNNRSLVLPLSYGLMEGGCAEAEKVSFQQLKTVKIHCVKDIITGPTGPTHFDYSFLENCPHLMTLIADIKWDVENSRYQIEATLTDKETEHWTCKLMERAIEYNRAAFEDITYLLNFVRPTDLTLKVTMDLLTALTPFASTRLRTLNLHQETLVTAPINKIIPALQRKEALNNVKKFAWVPEIHHITANSDVDESIANRAALSNVVTVRLDRSKLFAKDDAHAVLFLDTWNQQKISRIVPNTKLLILSYCSTSSGTENLTEDPLKVLKLAKSFENLDHLVLLDMRIAKDRDRCNLTNYCPFSHKDFGGFQGLQSITFILRSNLMMPSYIELMLDACALMPSLTRIGIVYFEATGNLDPLPERLEGFPPRVIATCGHSARLTGDVKLLGLENAFITWEEIKSF